MSSLVQRSRSDQPRREKLHRSQRMRFGVLCSQTLLTKTIQKPFKTLKAATDDGSLRFVSLQVHYWKPLWLAQVFKLVPIESSLHHSLCPSFWPKGSSAGKACKVLSISCIRDPLSDWLSLTQQLLPPQISSSLYLLVIL